MSFFTDISHAKMRRIKKSSLQYFITYDKIYFNEVETILFWNSIFSFLKYC